MKKIELEELGAESAPVGRKWTDLSLSAPWPEIISVLAPSSQPSDIQFRAIEAGLLSSRRNLLIKAPTNSGKSLLAYLAMIATALKGRRAILLEPLRAISQEKYDELRALGPALERILGRPIGVSITTGDYRLDEETLQSPPPDGGELVIATPERIEAIMRQPESDAWLQSIATVVVDEAHMLGDRMRGASLEYVVTSFLCMPAPPRIILMSATLGDTTNLLKWLQPADLVDSTVRFPKLKRTICGIEREDDPHAVLLQMVEDILRSASSHCVLIFVYQTAWTLTLARDLNAALGSLAGTEGALAYHSRLSSATRASVRNHFLAGNSRCVVTTAALAMGVNLPASHVIVRDTTTGPGAPLPAGTIVQMMGRAGRGSSAGHSFVFSHESREPSPDQLLEQLSVEYDHELRSALLPSERTHWGSAGEPPLAETLLSLLSRRTDDGLTREKLDRFLERSMNGAEVLPQCDEALRWLSSASRPFAFQENGVWKATRLGQATIRGSLPLTIASGISSLIRDLLAIDESDQRLLNLSKLDLLLLIELMADRPMLRKPFSEKAASQIDDFTSRTELKSEIFREWIRGKPGFSKATEVVGSLGIGTDRKNSADSDRKTAYTAMLRAIILWQRANGVLVADIERRWDVKDLEEIQEQWRDDRLFLLAAMLPLWDIRCFFFHLKEECNAATERILRVKRALQRLKCLSAQLMSLVGWCSPLGPLFCRMRSNLPKAKGGSPARATMLTLEAAGVTADQMIHKMTIDDYVALGIRKDLAAQIHSFTVRVRRR